VADQDGDNGRDAIFQGLDLEPGTTVRRVVIRPENLLAHEHEADEDYWEEVNRV
jgi:hypothetical protein